jgi:hypothetical protein
MNEFEILAGRALRLLKEVDQVLVVDVIRLNDIELSMFEEGLVHEIQSLHKEHSELIRRYEQNIFLNNKGVQGYLDEVKQKRRAKT